MWLVHQVYRHLNEVWKNHLTYLESAQQILLCSPVVFVCEDQVTELVEHIHKFLGPFAICQICEQP